MSNFTDFLKSRIFLINLAIAVALFFIVFWGASKFLDSYTRHGDFIVLPDLSRKSLPDVEALLKEKGLKYVVIDSTYDEKLPPRTVINQVPYIGAHVKSGRNIYLYITTAVAPMVEIPVSGVIDAPFASAKQILEHEGLKIAGISKQIDICVDCVLKIIYKGKTLMPGDKLPKGSKIELVLGRDANAPADE